MEPVKLGIIGCGVIGSSHLRTAVNSSLIDLVAVADLIEENRQQAIEQFQPKRIYNSSSDLLDDEEIEAVVLAFPTQYRTQVALEAFSKGKHVLTEKPVAINANQVREMIAARGNLIAGCCSSRNRFHKSAQVTTEFIQNGGLGDLRVVRCRAIVAAGEQPTTPRPTWRLIKALNGGGILVNWGCYDLDYLLGITSWTLKPETVFAQTWTVPSSFESHVAPGSDAETYYLATVRCRGGIILSMERGEFMTAQSESDWQVIGSKGSLKLKMTDSDPRSIIHDSTTAEKGVISKPLWNPTGNSIATDIEDPLVDFAAAIREERQPLTSLEQSLILQEITDAIYKSAAQGVSSPSSFCSAPSSRSCLFLWSLRVHNNPEPVARIPHFAYKVAVT